MIEITLEQIINSHVKCSNLTKKVKREIDETILRKGLKLDELQLGAKIYILRNKLNKIPKCKACDKELVYHGPSCSYRTYCSSKCSLNSEETLNKRRHTNLIKYGTTNALNSKGIKESTKKKMLEKHGVEMYSQSQEYKQRISDGNIITSFSVLSREERRFRVYKRVFSEVFPRFKNKVIPLFTIDEFKGGGPGKHYEWECVRCQTVFKNYYNRQKGVWPKCPNCDSAYSDIEYFVINLLAKYDIPHRKRDRKTIFERELDLYIEHLNLAIETNGLYFHSEKKIEDPLYHIKKTTLCQEKEINLLQIFADEIYYKKPLCSAKIKNALRINRKIDLNRLELRYIQNCTNFLNKYTFEKEKEASFKLGAFYKNRLVAVATFKENKVIQFAAVNCFDLEEALAKICKKYVEDYNTKNLFYEADIRWEPSKTKQGFDLVNVLSPKCWFTKDFLKRTEDYQEGYIKIWDCGYNQFIFSL